MTGYRVYYNAGTDQGSTDVVAGDTTVTLTGLTLGVTYNITIVALSSHLPSPVVRALTATFGK